MGDIVVLSYRGLVTCVDIKWWGRVVCLKPEFAEVDAFSLAGVGGFIPLDQFLGQEACFVEHRGGLVLIFVFLEELKGVCITEVAHSLHSLVYDNLFVAILLVNDVLEELLNLLDVLLASFHLPEAVADLVL